MERGAYPASISIIGAGPAGLAAAEVAARAGVRVTIHDHMPSPARKLLMAGKSGLNITHDGPPDTFGTEELAPILSAFGPTEIRDWMDGLGQPSFIGSTGRVFPKAMKASPLLRAWLARLADLGVTLETRARWTGWTGDALRIGDRLVTPDATILALGGASWRRLGSDGAWADLPGLDGIVAPFAPSNIGFRVAWSEHMTRHFGHPIKNAALIVDGVAHRGEVTLSAEGLEGGGLYPLTPRLRDGAPLTLDLKPDLTVEELRDRLARTPKASLPNRLRKLGLDPVQIALVQEWGRPVPSDLAPLLKALPVPLLGPRDMDQAISTAGGLRWDALDADLMMISRPGTFACGEMLDWEAPTGGHLLTACLATGRWAGAAAARHAMRA
ncbi:TIGR03862 family flavoprotein [uncultured Jannaschia sp.]|uniref:TIGR03862 family flavoprotein n=1 Tax=uncultured Jannaschia sp. TaxID=293347 RepID=UPI00262B5918|nr:TIGR03862 family flavoprotein [uncultured Jannaschia sp.]